MKRLAICLLAACLTAAACVQGGGQAAQAPRVHPFPSIQVPAVYSDPQERIEYMIEHYWDQYFSEGGVTDTGAVLGVRKGDVEQAFANYVALMDSAPMKSARRGMSNLLRKLENEQARDTSKLTYLVFTEIVSRYLYDPNSPLRNEDYYLPFVKGMAESRFTREDMRPAYRYEARTCSVNQYGQVAPDFKFRTLSGKVYSLHGIKAEYTMLFFSNPYCHSCKGIIQDVMSRRYMADMISGGRLAVVNVYIDEEVDKWREYAPNYPASWYSGYDHLFRIRNDEKYCVRAIPSLYLLDRGKHILMKDAPTEKVLAYLDKNQ